MFYFDDVIKSNAATMEGLLKRFSKHPEAAVAVFYGTVAESVTHDLPANFWHEFFSALSGGARAIPLAVHLSGEVSQE